MKTLKLKSVSVHVGVYSKTPNVTPGAHRSIIGLDESGAVWEYVEDRHGNHWQPLVMESKEG